MDKTTIKCPQCGASHIQHINTNHYSCPYSGYTFSVSGGSNFVNQETDEFKIAQKIEEEKFKTTIWKRWWKRKKKEMVIIIIGMLVLGPPLWYLMNYVDGLKDKEMSFETDYDRIAFLEAAPFTAKGTEIVFSDFCRKVTINGVTKEASALYVENKSIWIWCSGDSTVAYVGFDGEKLAKRPMKISVKPIFTFKDEVELRNYLCEKPFVFMDEKLTFAKQAYSLDYNNEVITNEVIVKLTSKGRHFDSAFNTVPIDSRASISYLRNGVKEYLYLIMDEEGNNAYLLNSDSKKKYKRLD